ncbi:MAG: YihY/virulence factor BrkB family protein [Catalinimonas sp.]
MCASLSTRIGNEKKTTSPNGQDASPHAASDAKKRASNDRNEAFDNSKGHDQKFNLKDLWPMLKETYKEWNGDDPFRQAAIVAYYAVLSLPALLIIIITIVGSIYGKEATQGQITNQISGAIGAEAAASIEEMIANSAQDQNSTLAVIFGIAMLVFGATGVFVQLQRSLNYIWEVKVDPKAGVLKVITDRATSLGLILVIGFLLLTSLALTSVLSALGDWIQQFVPDFLMIVFFVAEFVVSLGIITLLFAMMFKYLPDVKVEWRTVWIGALATSILFVIGKFALGIYFGHSEPGSAYGAAGSIILVLVWVSYSSLILFFGAEFTQVYARRYGHRIEPDAHAIRVPDWENARQLRRRGEQREEEEEEATA